MSTSSSRSTSSSPVSTRAVERSRRSSSRSASTTTEAGRRLRAAALGVVFTAGFTACATAGDHRLVACGSQETGNEVVRTLELARARDYRRVLPDVEFPQLEVDAPVLLVFYDGPTVIVEVRHGARAKIIRQSPICAWFSPDRVLFLGSF